MLERRNLLLSSPIILDRERLVEGLGGNNTNQKFREEEKMPRHFGSKNNNWVSREVTMWHIRGFTNDE